MESRSDELQFTVNLLERSMHTPPAPLTGHNLARGPAVYLIRYTGRLPLYRDIAGAVAPIYIGSTAEIRGRLHAHRRKIQRTPGLRLDDFVVIILRGPSHAWALYSEALLIDAWQPVWNKCVTGFGNALTGAARIGQRQPAWVTLHPGSPAAGGTTDTRATDIRRRVRNHLDHVYGPWCRDGDLLAPHL